jgi:signal transduction histidine kinase
MPDFSEAALRERIGEYLEDEACIVMLRVDAAGVIRGANGYARRLTGLTLLGASLGDLLITGVEGPELSRWLSPSERPRLMNLRGREGLPQTIYVTTLADAGGWLLLGQADPGEQELLRRELLALNQELTEKGRELAQANAELARLNAVKNTFLGMATHDLRKPVGLILLRAEQLLEQADDTPDQGGRRELAGIIASANSMARLIDDFLDLSCIEAERLNLDLQPVDPQALAAGALALVEPLAARRGVELRQELDPACGRLRVDGPKLEQALTNLLSNAVEHAPERSSVLLASRLAAGGIRFWVEDQGIGVAPGELARLFAAFSGSGGVKPGGERSVGLGLAIVRQVVAAHGGSCFVEPVPGGGARFGFLLPGPCRGALR